MSSALHHLALVSTTPGTDTNDWRKSHSTLYDQLVCECASWDKFRLQSLSLGDSVTISEATTLIVADPFVPRSGYLNKQICRRMAKLSLSSAIRGRLSSAIPQIIERPGRMELRAIGKLARMVVDVNLIRDLRAACNSRNGVVACRAGYLLHDLAQMGFEKASNDSL